MSRREKERDTIESLARALVSRVAWEHELGVQGYAKAARVPKAAARRAAASTDPARAVLEDPAEDPAAALADLRAEIGECTRCPLHRGRRHIVFGEGDPRARLVFVGEGPGRDEDRAGRPFVGAAGQLLDKIIGAMGLAREGVYICNVVKCRPPENRVPADEEAATCGAFLRRQIAAVGPEVVVALGATAAAFLLGRKEPLGAVRGRFHAAGGWQVMPTYHPAYLLRNASGKRPVWEDMQQVLKALGLSPPGGRDGR